jgi:phosphoribosyl-ATP pyrophosphohydrolase/phosphoribosyl-AMP cyclohydrolase
MTVNINDLKFPYKFGNKDLIPAIIWNTEKGPLSLFYMDEAAVKKSLETGYVWRYSRQHKKLMMKGATSGNRIKILEISPDCDYDALSIEVIPEGPACHTGHDSCFYKRN